MTPVLDDVAAIGRLDPAGALVDVEGSAQQWARAGELARAQIGGLDLLSGVDAVVVAGVGGSGISGDVVAAIAAPALRVPVVVHKAHGLPAFVGPRTLVVGVSYSGETEETRSSDAAAREAGARRLVVSRGGPLLEAARADGVPAVEVPAGPQPRHALGYLSVPVLVALGLADDLDAAISRIGSTLAAGARDLPTAGNAAKRLGLRIATEGLSTVLGGPGVSAVAGYRFKCQLNENAKLPVLFAQLPEAGHNEVVPWVHDSPRTKDGGLLSLRDATDSAPVARRFDVVEDFAARRLPWVESVTAVGDSPLERLAGLLTHLDLVSIYSAIALERDPTPIQLIDELKARLVEATAASAPEGARP